MIDVLPAPRKPVKTVIGMGVSDILLHHYRCCSRAVI